MNDIIATSMPTKDHNMPITYSETFYSIQGEGHFTGVPSTWVRFFLCNLQCNGFGQDDPTDSSTYELPYKEFDASKIKVVTELPVWDKGCDSSYSWAKKFRHLQKHETADQIVDKLKDHLTTKWNPNGLYKHPNSGETAHLVFTGGEPLMRNGQRSAIAIMQAYRSKPMEHKPSWVTFETNGTQKLTQEFMDFFGNPGVFHSKLFWSCSPKLWTVSGEKRKRAIKPDNLKDYDLVVHQNRGSSEVPRGQLKFVLGPKKEQWDELDEVIGLYREAGIDWPVWIMPVGATVEGQELCDGEVATMAQERGFSVSARVHTYLWGNLIGV
jgi:6-pyruvoyltetrahydropterin 2'-reductase